MHLQGFLFAAWERTQIVYSFQSLTRMLPKAKESQHTYVGKGLLYQYLVNNMHHQLNETNVWGRRRSE